MIMTKSLLQVANTIKLLSAATLHGRRRSLRRSRKSASHACLCLSGSLPLIFLYVCAYFEANEYDDDDHVDIQAM